MTNLNQLKSLVNEFEQKAGFDKTEARKLLEMLKEEMSILENEFNNKQSADHQLVDIIILALQLANRFDTDLDAVWTLWFEKSKKYLEG